jgi:hypothetical protein
LIIPTFLALAADILEYGEERISEINIKNTKIKKKKKKKKLATR